MAAFNFGECALPTPKSRSLPIVDPPIVDAVSYQKEGSWHHYPGFYRDAGFRRAQKLGKQRDAEEAGKARKWMRCVTPCAPVRSLVHYGPTQRLGTVKRLKRCVSLSGGRLST